MTIAQRVNKSVTTFKQTGLGVPKSGTGGQSLRRETANGKLAIAVFENNEITTHQQSTGITHGGRSASFALNGLLSGNTYSEYQSSLLRAAWAATTPVTAASITVAAPGGGLYTLTDAANTFLTKGLKIGDVIRITAGTYSNAVNRDNNIVITALTETVITGMTVNASVMIAEGPIASSTVTIMGKKCKPPLTAHTADYYTVEEWQSDISQSELFTDAVISDMTFGIPADGNTTFAMNMFALDRTQAAAQVLTTPTAETTTEVAQGVKGIVIIQGAKTTNVTSAEITIDGGSQPLSNVLGSNTAPDVARGILKVSGTITAFYEDAVLSGYYDAATNASIVLIAAVDATNDSEFVAFSMSNVKIEGDDKDDGDAGVTRSYPFTAAINGSGGAALANDKCVVTLQDSLAA